MEQHFVMISDSMEKHGEHGTAFLMISDSMGKHGEHGNSSFSCLQIAWKSMGSMVQQSLIISDSMEKHGEHGKAFSHDFRQHGKAWEAW